VAHKPGKGFTGHRHTLESKFEMTLAHIGKHPGLGIPKSAEHRAKIALARRGSKASDETRAKMSAASRRSQPKGTGPNLGRIFSPNVRAKMSASRLGKKRGKYNITDDGRRRQREAVARGLHASNRVTSIEKLVKEVLDRLGIDYVFQYPVATYVADFYIPSRNLILECDGEYWHSLPAMQARDARHDTELQALGYTVARLSGAAIKADALNVVKERLQFQYS